MTPPSLYLIVQVADSSASDTTGPELAVDGDTTSSTSEWISSTTPGMHWLAIDLAGDYLISAANVVSDNRGLSGGGQALGLCRYEVQVCVTTLITNVKKIAKCIMGLVHDAFSRVCEGHSCLDQTVQTHCVSDTDCILPWLQVWAGDSNALLGPAARSGCGWTTIANEPQYVAQSRLHADFTPIVARLVRVLINTTGCVLFVDVPASCWISA